MNTMVDPVEIGKRLRLLRGKSPRTKIAKQIGISYSALSKYEDGKKVPCDKTKCLIANFYDVSVQQLFFEPDYYVTT